MRIFWNSNETDVSNTDKKNPCLKIRVIRVLYYSVSKTGEYETVCEDFFGGKLGKLTYVFPKSNNGFVWVLGNVLAHIFRLSFFLPASVNKYAEILLSLYHPVYLHFRNT